MVFHTSIPYMDGPAITTIIPGIRHGDGILHIIGLIILCGALNCGPPGA